MNPVVDIAAHEVVFGLALNDVWHRVYGRKPVEGEMCTRCGHWLIAVGWHRGPLEPGMHGCPQCVDLRRTVR